MLLLDEPASALDPVATASIEDLMHELKHRYTIVIVTHNMQQAARVADRTAFFSLDTSGLERVGTLVEYDDTDVIFTRPSGYAHAGLRHRALRVAARAVRSGRGVMSANGRSGSRQRAITGSRRPGPARRVAW